MRSRNTTLWKRNLLPPLALIAVLGLAPSAAFAAEEPMSQIHGNILWTLIAAILVMFMQAGFAAVEAGFTQAKNAGNIFMKNVLDFSAGSVIFFLFGFAFMFGTDMSGLLGGSGFAL
ncbi:MAG: ammonium transporter, partial [Thermodesulfobacteriota bacterium]